MRPGFFRIGAYLSDERSKARPAISRLSFVGQRESTVCKITPVAIPTSR